MKDVPDHWMVEVKTETADSAQHSILLKLAGGHSGEKREWVVASSTTMEDFRGAVASIKKELDRLVGEAEKKVEEFTGVGAAEEDVPAEAIWQNMEKSPSEQDMFAYFNAFTDAKRQQVAEYIFSHASMFKGRGPVFAEHYNALTYVLE